MFRNLSATLRRKKQARASARIRRGVATLLRRFEPLEDRRLLAAVSWIGSAAGNWDVASNWSTHAVPTSADDVTISTASAATITIKSGDTESIHSLALDTNDTLSITGGTLTTSAGLTNSGTINVSPGCILTVGGSYIENAGATLTMPGGPLGTDPVTNVTNNSDFELPVAKNSTTNPSSWGFWGSSYLSTQYAYTGAQSLFVSGTNSGVVESFSVTPGVSYTASTYAMTPSTNRLTGSENGQLQLLFFDSKGNQISTYDPPNSVIILTSASATGGPSSGSVGNQGWNHFSTTAVAPSNAASAKVQVTTWSPGGAAGGSVYYDDVKAGPSAGGLSKLVAGSVSNSGSITVGPTNIISTSGSFAQTSTGTLDVQIGGAPASGSTGLVNIGGAATLAGTLKADLVSGYSPATTDSFTLMGYASATGTFSSYQLPSGSNYQFQGAVTFTNVVVSAVPTAALTTNVDTTGLHPVPSNFLGINLTTWDQDLPTAGTQQMSAAAGLAAYRFPGGSDSDFYHFNTATNLYAIDNFVQFVQFIMTAGGPGLVTLDYGSGSPQEAAAQLAYLEGSPTDTTPIGTGIEWTGSTDNVNGHWSNINWGTVGYWASLRGASPLASDDGLNFMRIAHPAAITNIKYWEVGNEVYGSWEVDHHGTAGPGGVSTGAQHDPTTYVNFAQQFSNLATEILSTAGDPAISIGIDSADPTGATDGLWTLNVLLAAQRVGFVPGFISDHSYMQQPGSESDSGLLNNTVSQAGNILDWTTRYTDYEGLLTAIMPSKASSVLVMATETNSVYFNPGKQTTSLVNGLFIANSLGSLLDSGYNGAFVWDLRNSWETGNNNSNLLYGWRPAGDYGLLGDPTVNVAPQTGPYIPYPDFFAMQLAAQMVDGGGEVVSATSNYAELDTYAVLEPSGTLDLFVINTNPAANLTDQFNLAGFQPSGSAQVWQYGKAQDAAQSQSVDGASALANFSTTLSLSGANFSYTFPAYSMTVIKLAPAASVTISGSGVLNTVVSGSSSNPGTLVSALLAGGVTITGAGPTPGIAIDGADNSNGGWQFSINSGADWTPLGSPSDSSALLLLADAETLVRFVPNAGFSGTVASGLTFRAWNPTSGANGSTANVSSNGGSTLFSSGTATASISVNLFPTVVGVYAAGSTWQPGYEDFLDSSKVGGIGVTGASEQGYSLPGGSGQYTSLDWTNLDTLRIAFSEDVDVQPSALTLTGASAEPAVTDFSYDPVHFIATWTFAASLGMNANLIHLDGTQVSDASGALLDGWWSDLTSTFIPQGGKGSGNGTPGSDFNFGFYTLPGDIKGTGTILSGAAIQVRNALGSSVGDSIYSFRDDVRGLGTILSSAFVLVRNDLGNSTDFLSVPMPPSVPGNVPGVQIGVSLDQDSPTATVSADTTVPAASTPALVASADITTTLASETSQPVTASNDGSAVLPAVFEGLDEAPDSPPAADPAVMASIVASLSASNRPDVQPGLALIAAPIMDVITPELAAKVHANLADADALRWRLSWAQRASDWAIGLTPSLQEAASN